MARPNAPMKREKAARVLTEADTRVLSHTKSKKQKKLLKLQRQSAKAHKYRESDCLV